MNIRKEFPVARTHKGNVGIQPIYEIDHADWVWHPDVHCDEPCFVIFRAAFEVTGDMPPLKFHISADQRYELYCDGKRIAKGPDRSDIDHWTFSSYICELTNGQHVLEAHIWWLDNLAPEALVTYRGGFIFKADDCFDAILTTGGKSSNWQVGLRSGWSFTPADFGQTYYAAGDCQKLNGDKWLGESIEWKTPIIVREAVPHSFTGISVNGWKLFPTILPSQIDRNITPGKFRALVNADVPNDYLYTDADCNDKALQEWNTLIEKENNHITIDAFQTINVIWDLEDYYCGFCELEIDKGTGASIEWEWAESLFNEGDIKNKGNRDNIAGKWWRGFGHTVEANGEDNQHYRFYWWNAGRFCRIRIKTGAQPLVLNALIINETRYPLENESTFECDDVTIPAIRKISTRVMQMCAHETYMDCPYYEQMMYVGDTRLELLTHYIMQSDTRLPRHAIELFDYSRKDWGFTTERVTSRNLQLSPTFSLIWIWMVHDYLYWRGDPNWVADRMIGVRSSLEYFRPYLNTEGLLEGLPGWPFVDWVLEWDTGYPPGATDNISSIVNLHYLLALQKAADIDSQLGETDSAISLQAQADRVAKAIKSTFWNKENGLIQDDLTGQTYSEHAQCLALLSGIFTSTQEQTILNGLLTKDNLARTTVYFSYYLFKVYVKYGHIEKLFKAFDFWRTLTVTGFKTTVEAPEPSRSDCHAWGAHPMIHFITGILGLQPTKKGMTEIIIAPQPGALEFIKGTVPSPQGEISYDLKFSDRKCKGTLTLPSGMSGIFRWNEKDIYFQGHIDI